MESVGFTGAGGFPLQFTWCAAHSPVGFTSMGIKQQAELIQRVLIVLAPTADIAVPGGKIWHGDEVFTQPGEIGDEFQVHVTSLALKTGDGVGGLLTHKGSAFMASKR